MVIKISKKQYLVKVSLGLWNILPTKRYGKYERSPHTLNAVVSYIYTLRLGESKISILYKKRKKKKSMRYLAHGHEVIVKFSFVEFLLTIR